MVGWIVKFILKLKDICIVFIVYGWVFIEGVKLVKKFLYLVIEKLMLFIIDSIICVLDFDK